MNDPVEHTTSSRRRLQKAAAALCGVAVAFFGYRWVAWQQYYAQQEVQHVTRPSSVILNSTKECLEGRESAMLQGGIIDTMNSPPKPGCPGYDDYTPGDIGTYQLGPYTFKLPRDYLSFGKYEEGERDRLSLFIEFPSMHPGVKQYKTPGWSLDQIVLRLEFNDSCSSHDCISRSQSWYNTLILNDIHGNHAANWITNYDNPVNTEYDGLKMFSKRHVKNSDLTEVYFSGSKESPNYWYACKVSVASKSCKTYYQHTNGIDLELRFDYRNLKNHLIIKEKVGSFIERHTASKGK